MIDFTNPASQRLIDWLERKPVDHMWTIGEIVESLKGAEIFPRNISLEYVMKIQHEYVTNWFDKKAYYHLKPEVKHHILARKNPDPIWLEHLQLTEKIKDNLYYEPFVVQCDDKDFLQGALDTALTEAKEPNWFDWYIEFHSKGDDEGDYWEIKHFEEDD